MKLVQTHIKPALLRELARDALDALVAENKGLRYGLRIIAEHSSDDASRQLARAVLDD